MTHFNFPETDISFYFDISSIEQTEGTFQLSGTVGDGSAEAWFEAQVGERTQVCILPIWDGGDEALCQRYDQGRVEQVLAEKLEDLSFHTKLIFDQAQGCWRQQVLASQKSIDMPSRYEMRFERPHHQVCEPEVIWRQVSAC